MCSEYFVTYVPEGSFHGLPASASEVHKIRKIRELRPITGSGRCVFPAIRGGGRPLSETTLNGALRRLGYSSDQMTAHGFRSITTDAA